MIARPLNLSTRLRPEPRSYDVLFYVNVALLAFYFVLFGSRFVVSPGLGVGFALPEVPGANADPRPTTHVISVVNAGQIFVGDGLRSMEQLQEWLTTQATTERRQTGRMPVLLVRSSAEVPAAILARIVGMAHGAGFQVTLAAEDPVRTGGGS
ncbi:hypothetical protein [Opitutus sp. ER46]|uniref:ExbD/TolR family protein n=1 Tax=Opitutus sp. ER46 TaxID=2161864 RepID=UPI000D31A87E|nr:hypothetical protein [Opitutus sp. ER46]PTX92398.1 hypothetical protein DB354_13755 [Opitutus sp. ER46]